MPTNKNYVSLVEWEETASVEWLYNTSRSAMCYTEVLVQINRVWCYSKACYMVELISWEIQQWQGSHLYDSLLPQWANKEWIVKIIPCPEDNFTLFLIQRDQKKTTCRVQIFISLQEFQQAKKELWVCRAWLKSHYHYLSKMIMHIMGWGVSVWTGKSNIQRKYDLALRKKDAAHAQINTS